MKRERDCYLLVYTDTKEPVVYSDMGYALYVREDEARFDGEVHLDDRVAVKKATLTWEEKA